MWKEGGAEGDGRCGEQLSVDTRISTSRLVFRDVPCCSGISVNTEICLERLYSSAGSLLSARILKLRAERCSEIKGGVLSAWHAPPSLGLPVPVQAGRRPRRLVQSPDFLWRLPHQQGGRAEMNLAKTSTTSLCCFGEPHLKCPRKPLKKIALFLLFFFRVGTFMTLLSNTFSSQKNLFYE